MRKHNIAINFSARYFSQVFLGLYLLVFFISLIPQAPTLLSSEAMHSALFGAIPNPLNVFKYLHADFSIQIYLCFLCFLALTLLKKDLHFLIPLLLWNGWVSIDSRLIYIMMPHSMFIGWLLLALTVLFIGKKYLSSQVYQHSFLKLTLLAGWTTLSASYFVSGVSKAQTDAWTSGLAFIYSGLTPISRGWFWETASLVPDLVSTGLCYSVMILQIFIFIGLIFKRARKVLWLSSLSLHFGTLLLFNIPSVSLGMIIFHLFLLGNSRFEIRFSSPRFGRIHWDTFFGVSEN